MGDVSAEPSMEDILSSIKRIIAEEAEPAAAARTRRSLRPAPPPPADHAHDEDVLELSEPAPAPPPQLRTAAPRPEPILSGTAAEASRQPLEMLSRLIVRPDTPGSDTLEGLVREMLRPMLREWLDAHLPQIVETMVGREIARITSQG